MKSVQMLYSITALAYRVGWTWDARRTQPYEFSTSYRSAKPKYLVLRREASLSPFIATCFEIHSNRKTPCSPFTLPYQTPAISFCSSQSSITSLLLLIPPPQKTTQHPQRPPSSLTDQPSSFHQVPKTLRVLPCKSSPETPMTRFCFPRLLVR
jgi:hypothetical protein